MKRFSIPFIVALLMVLPNILWAASLYNSDAVPYACRIKSRMGLNEEKVYPESTVYFDCTYGCEIILLKTGQTITLESDADVVIDDGILRLR